MPTPDNTVSLLINGKTHGQWTDYDIVSDLLTPADDFSVTLGRPVDAKPDAVRAGRIVNDLRAEGVLISATGPQGHVLKIRPPLTFSLENVEYFLARLARVLG